MAFTNVILQIKLHTSFAYFFIQRCVCHFDCLITACSIIAAVGLLLIYLPLVHPRGSSLIFQSTQLRNTRNEYLQLSRNVYFCTNRCDGKDPQILLQIFLVYISPAAETICYQSVLPRFAAFPMRWGHPARIYSISLIHILFHIIVVHLYFV